MELSDVVPRLHSDTRGTSILLVSNDSGFREQARARLAALRWSAKEAANGAETLELLQAEGGTEVVLLDPALPDLIPVELCSMIQQRFPHIEVLFMNTASCHVIPGSSAPSPFASRLTDLLLQETGLPQRDCFFKPTEHLRHPANGPRLRGMVGQSGVMQQVYARVHMVAVRDTTVLITGESGTGKDLIAQAIHDISPRKRSPFVVVNCAAIPEALLEAELFGHAKGAFTGAMNSRIGRIHAAHGGTLFLDEIGDMPLMLQSKLLRFVEQGEVQRLGSNDNLRVDVRVIAATNAELPSLVKQKLFREDLYYRLSVFPIRMPPLRDRKQDVPELTEFFVSKLCPEASLSLGALDLLCKHDWPGNVRELRNVIERAGIMAGTGREIDTGAISF